MRGVERPPKVLIPRMKNEDVLPGSPLVVTEITPESLPARLFVSDDDGARSLSPATAVIEPVTEILFCVPAPTTTASIISLSGIILTFSIARSPTRISLWRNPM